MPKRIWNKEEEFLINSSFKKLQKNAADKYGKGDEARVLQAFKLANEAHSGIRRKSGEPYILHPIAVARIVSEEIGLGTNSIIAALLHDTIEDTDLKLEDIEDRFDRQIARIIDGLTKIAPVFDVQTSDQAENFRKLLLTLTDDIRVVLIKIADRLHNMRTMQAMIPEKQRKISSETLFLYAPLAHRMGLYNIKSELEDLSMKYTRNEEYKEIAQKLNETKRARSRYINQFIKPIKELLDEKGFDCEVIGRPKSIHSIWKKMAKKGVTFEEVYDLFAIRIILNSPAESERDDCWAVFSSITNLYQHNPTRLRDWISNPKSNGYESLHTTVMGPRGKWVEVQIRSSRMHDVAERGVAAHWIYKEGDGDIEKSSEAIDPWLENVRNLLQDKEQNALELVDQFKSNLFSHEVYCFTPKGELRRLKRGATALDFAYEIHSAIGNKCIATKANQKLVPLSYELKTGDQIEILTSRKQKPKEDWLSIAQTSKAISAIKRALKHERRALASEGKAIFDRKAKRQNIPNTQENLNKILEVLDLPDSQEFFIQIQQGLNLSKVWTKFTLQNGQLIRKVNKAKPKLSVEETVIQNLQRKGELLIMGEESETIDHSFAQCCNPLPGDNVFGFITLNDGIKIHRVNCPNAVQLMSKYSYRIVQTSWSSKLKTSFLAHVQLRGIDGMGVVSRVTQRISHELNINIKSLSFESDQGVFTGHISLYVNNQNELQYILDNLKKQEGIVSVERIDDHTTLHHNI